MKIKGQEDFRGYGQTVLETFEDRAAKAGIEIARPSYEGVRLIFADGWALLRMSLLDPKMPLTIESKHAGGCESIAAAVKKLLDGFDALDLSVFNK